MPKEFSLLKSNRQKLEMDLARSSKWWIFSPENYSQFRCTIPMIEEYAFGKVIDLGCGRLALQPVIQALNLAYDGLDLNPSSSEVTYEADIQKMPLIADGSYDTALCLQVLEHVPEPQKAAHEIFRILRQGGVAFITVPHLSRIHDEPNDFYRYTEYGIRVLLEHAGFRIDEILIRAGMFSFLGHQISSVINPLVWNVPLLRELVYGINSVIFSRGCYYLDQLTPSLMRYFPLGYTVRVTKP
ncbi:MAG: class I SAM-dependent methyltransferase [Anaerolineales bacterium]